MLINNENEPCFGDLDDSARARLEMLWSKYQPYADAKFRSHFSINESRHPRFWEMYLANSLIAAGLKLVPRAEYSNETGPDLLSADPGRKICIEAIAPQSGHSAGAVHDSLPDGLTHDISDAAIIRRYCHAFETKFKKFRKYERTGDVGLNDPCVIAISGSDIPLAWKESFPPRIVRALLPFGDRVITVDCENGKFNDEGFMFQNRVATHTAHWLPTDVFLDKKYKQISAVIFSYARVELELVPLRIGADLLVVYNPLARNKLPLGWLKIGREYWVEGDDYSYCMKSHCWNSPAIHVRNESKVMG